MAARRERNSAETFLDLARRIAGPEAADAIVVARGGTEIAVPRIATRDHWLSQAVGFETAKLICKEMAVEDADGQHIGFRCYLPAGQTSLYARFKADIRRKVAHFLGEGFNAPEIAVKVGCSERLVRRYIADLRAANRRARDRSPMHLPPNGPAKGGDHG